MVPGMGGVDMSSAAILLLSPFPVALPFRAGWEAALLGPVGALGDACLPAPTSLPFLPPWHSLGASCVPHA